MRRVVLGLGSNIGNRSLLFNKFLQNLRVDKDISLLKTSYLYSSPPALYKDQPEFLNAAIEIKTALDFKNLLLKLQTHELKIDHGIRYGPRKLDIDIIFAENEVFQDKMLTIPHARLAERDFVLKPLVDLGYGGFVVPKTDRTVNEMLDKVENSESRRVVEFKTADKPILWHNISTQTRLMGIMNLTPDSFSDGGMLMNASSESVQLNEALLRAKEMVEQGADIIDIGGESTRPNADPVSVEEEWLRISSVLERLLKECQTTCVSVDTLKPIIAQRALQLGVQLVNDVRGEDKESDRSFQDGADIIFNAVAYSNAAISIMHSKGNSKTMNSLTTTYKGNDCVTHVKNWLQNVVKTLVETYYVPRWNIWVDPGFGFAKDINQNFELLNRLNEVVDIHDQVLIGTSRKRFVKSFAEGERNWTDLDVATSLTTLVGCQKGARVFRVHNLNANKLALSFLSKLEDSTKN